LFEKIFKKFFLKTFTDFEIRVLVVAHSEDFVILACFKVQTDGRTPRRWLRRAKHSAVARKKLWSIKSIPIL